MKKQTIIFLAIILTIFSCEDPVEPIQEPTTLNDSFSQLPIKALINSKSIPEISGIAASQTMSGYLWINQDSDNYGAGLALIDPNGELLKAVNTNGKITNRDWEDIAVGPGPVANKSYVYIGEIGDNGKTYDTKYIYRFQEMSNYNTEIGTVETIAFTYPNNEKYDAEALIVDPQTKDIYVFTKEIKNARVFKLAYPQRIGVTNIAEFVGTAPVNFATGASISPDGREIVIRSYVDVQYWQRLKKEPIADILKTTSKGLPYIIEPQGEAICFEQKATGYYTASEQSSTPNQYLYYYKRN